MATKRSLVAESVIDIAKRYDGQGRVANISDELNLDILLMARELVFLSKHIPADELPHHSSKYRISDRKEKILRLHAQGYSLRQIMRQTGYKSVRSVHQVVMKHKDKLQ